MSKPILCVDFDGVVHSYVSGWQGADVVADPPVPGALRWLRVAQQYWSVHVYSSRSREERGRAAMESAIRAWAEDDQEFESSGAVNAFVRQLTFSHEKPAANLTIDDRAVCFEGDWGDPALDPRKLLEFKPWNKRGATL